MQRLWWPLKWILIHKFVVLSIAGIAIFFFPDSFDLGNHSVQFIWPKGSEIDWTSRFKTWDTMHYLKLAQVGYETGHRSNAFYPIWPFLWAGFCAISQLPFLLGGFILANLVSGLALVMLYFHLSHRLDDKLAKKTLMLWLAYPGSLFFCFPYSESLTLLWIAVFFWAVDRQSLIGMSVASFLLPATRAIGVFMGFTSLAVALSQGRAVFKRWKSWCLVAIGPVAGFGLYALIMYWQTGDPWNGFEVQKTFIARATVDKLIDLPGFLRAFANMQWGHGYLTSVIDRTFFLFFLWTLVFLRGRWDWLVFSLCFGLVPAMTVSFMSYTRFLALVFPVFAIWAAATAGHRHHRLGQWIWLLLGASLMITQVIFAFRHINFKWAG